jgi:hypothetical protein
MALAMNTRWLAGRTFRVILPPLMLAGALIASARAGATASPCVSWTGVQPLNPSSSSNDLTGAAVLSSCNAWAVGTYFNGTANQTLIEHWNGSSWKQVSSPNPGGSADVLNGVAATSSSNAWAVGSSLNGTATQTLVLHWNGSSWKRVPSPNPGPNPSGSNNDNFLDGVAAASSSNAWAVGHYFNGSATQTLVLHWNGTSWKRVPSPNPGGSANGHNLFGVHAVSASNAWAVGIYFNGTANQTLVLHWNGTSWKRVPSPNPGGSSHDNVLFGVAASSPTNIWAVGDYGNGTAFDTLALHCC